MFSDTIFGIFQVKKKFSGRLQEISVIWKVYSFDKFVKLSYICEQQIIYKSVKFENFRD